MPIEDEVPKGTRLLRAEIPKLEEVWRRLSGIRGIFDDFTRGRSDLFLALFMRRDTWWLEREDGNGILYLTDITPGLSAQAHIVYWDKRLRGTEAFTLDCIRFSMMKFDLKKMNVFLPDFAGAAHSFAERIGMKKEGMIRRWSVSDGRMYDRIIYGMTIEEALNGTGLLQHEGSEQTPVIRLGSGTSEHPRTDEESAADKEAGNPVHGRSDVGDVGQHRAEPANDSGLPATDPADGGH